MSVATESLAARFTRFNGKNAQVGVIGLGYVGLPLALLYSQRGFRTTGFDTDPSKVEKLESGETYIRHIPASTIAAEKKQNRFCATTNFEELRRMDAIIICVPTPLDDHREPDLSYIRDTAETIREHLRPGQLVVLESTTYPGTTEELVVPILERGSGLRHERDFHVAFSPERIDPGHSHYDIGTVPKVVGGASERAAALAGAL